MRIFAVLDSFGKPGANLMNGEVKWLGSYDECMAVKPVRTDKSGVTTQPFSPKFCRMSAPVEVGPINGQVSWIYQFIETNMATLF